MTELFLIILICVLIALVTVFGILLLRKSEKKEPAQQELSMMEQRIKDSIQGSVRLFHDTISQNQQSIGQMQTAKFREMDIIIKDMYDTMEHRLESITRSMGEMHTLALGVNDLKKVLSNVKTRGILGELQLGAILKEILAPAQYEENIATIPGSRNVVEFAIKMPGSNGNPVYLPVDSKFPLDAYSALCTAKESGDTAEITAASKELTLRLKAFAKDIHTKYVAPPHTTDFAVMFLPIEGLYLEAVNSGLVEKLQKDYKVNIAGPSTFAAMLNALQMGFRTLAVEQRSVQVWELLNDVRTEFEKFADVLDSAQQHIRRADTELDKLAGVRTRAILKKLNSIEHAEDE